MLCDDPRDDWLADIIKQGHLRATFTAGDDAFGNLASLGRVDQAVQQLRAQGVVIPDEFLAHVAPLGWEHIALTGDYDWNTAKPVQALRPLRAVPEAFTRRAA